MQKKDLSSQQLLALKLPREVTLVAENASPADKASSNDPAAPPVAVPATAEVRERFDAELANVIASLAELPAGKSLYSRYQALKSGDHTATGEPPFTCYNDWAGTIDYIFQFAGEDQVTLQELLDLPEESECKKETGLPNELFSSDHLCLMARLRLKTN